MKKTIILFVLLGLFPSISLASDINSKEIISLTNQYRTSQGLLPLKESNTLNQAVDLKANDIVVNHYFSHTDSTGRMPWHFFEEVGYKFKTAGENLSEGFNTSDQVVNAWINSPEHRANLVNPNYTDIGVTTTEAVTDGKSQTLVVQFLGSALSKEDVRTSLLAQIEALTKIVNALVIQLQTMIDNQGRQTTGVPSISTPVVDSTVRLGTDTTPTGTTTDNTLTQESPVRTTVAEISFIRSGPCYSSSICLDWIIYDNNRNPMSSIPIKIKTSLGNEYTRYSNSVGVTSLREDITSLRGYDNHTATAIDYFLTSENNIKANITVSTDSIPDFYKVDPLISFTKSTDSDFIDAGNSIQSELNTEVSSSNNLFNLVVDTRGLTVPIRVINLDADISVSTHPISIEGPIGSGESITIQPNQIKTLKYGIDTTRIFSGNLKMTVWGIQIGELGRLDTRNKEVLLDSPKTFDLVIR